MPAATEKKELLELTQGEFEKLETLVESVSPRLALVKDEDDTSIKDVVAHRAHWIDLFLGWYADGKAGREVFIPAKGYKWNQLKQYNADLRAKQRRLSWAKAKVSLRDGHDKLLAFLQARSNRELYSGPLIGAANDWTLGRWAEATGPSHYRSAAKYIRARQRAEKAQ